MRLARPDGQTASLSTGHGLRVDQYRARWNLPREHPMRAPAYSAQRSDLAKWIGLGRRRRASPRRTGTRGNGKSGSAATAISTARKAADCDDDYLTWGRDQIRATIFRCASAIESMQREVIAKVALLIL